jgi:tRNA dimethylallyltransferase
LEREELYSRINQRVELMLQQGLVNEIQSLKEKGYHYSNYNSLNTVGVKEVFDMLDEKLGEEMVELIKQNTRRFAKRQMTWFRRYKLTVNLRRVNLLISSPVDQFANSPVIKSFPGLLQAC